MIDEQLAEAAFLDGATMPGGAVHERREQTWRLLAVRDLVLAVFACFTEGKV